MSTSSDKQDPVLEARELLSKATPGPWAVWDSCSWRRIGTVEPFRDGNVVCPITQNDGHPDLLAKREDLDLIARAPDLLFSLCNELEQLRAETLKGICVYCGYIEQYESLEQKSGDEGNRMRVEHIKQCPERPELKLIAELERLEQLNATQSDSIKALHEQERVYRAAIEAGVDFIEAVGRDIHYVYSPEAAATVSHAADDALTQLRAAITPKEKPDSQKEAKQQ